ncbi:MAG: hypothetical protein NW206_17590 [Hyphomonadaceae bacterium]|nr:hypothetical protein [Hyphomonadaceae bacterium]
MRLAISALVLSLGLAGCAVTDGHRQRERDDLARRISADAIAYNEAYSDAMSGQILLNILRARDRMPRQYMSMSGFSNSDPDSRGANVDVGGIPLNDLGDQWGFLGFGASRSTTLEPEYQVEPLATDAYTTVVLNPTRTDVFAQYWNAGWSRDLALLLATQTLQVEPLTGGAQPQVFNNSASTIRANCVGSSYDPRSGCAFVQAVRELVSATYRMPSIVVEKRDDGEGVGVCGLIAAYAPASPVYRTLDPEHGYCAPKIVAGDRLYTLSLRSLDGMVFYVGELLRADPDAFGADVLSARVNIAAPGIPGGEPTVPLFRIVPAEQAEDQLFAARLHYAGQGYAAGPAVSRLCDRADQNAACTNDVEHGDRSSTVLEFLGGILAVNQSERAVSAPQPRY